MPSTWRLVVLMAAVAACGGAQEAKPEAEPSASETKNEPATPPQERCDGGQAEACVEVAEALLAKDATDKAAAEQLARACELGAEGHCERANTLRKSWIGYGHGPREVNVLESLCKGGQLEACHDLAWALQEGVYADRDEARALELFKAGCDAKRADDCLRLGFFQDWNEGKLDAARRLELYGKACELDPRACEDLGDFRNKYLDEATAKATTFEAYEKACLAGAPLACKSARKLVGALDVSRDRQDALTSQAVLNTEKELAELTADCDRGILRRCQELAQRLAFTFGEDQDENLRSSLERSEPLCEAGDFHACLRLAQSHAKGQAVEADTDMASTYSQKARDLATAGCDAGDPQGCQDLATMLRKDGEVDEALALSTRACDAGLGQACSGVAFEYMKRGDGELTARAHERACETRQVRNCEAAARAYEEGDGVEKDEARAKALHGRACAAGITSACGGS